MDVKIDPMEDKCFKVSICFTTSSVLSKYFETCLKNTYAYMYECVGCIHPGIMLKPLFNSTNKDWKNRIYYRASRYNQTLAHDRIRFRYTQIYSPTGAVVAKDRQLTLFIIFIIIIIKANTPILTASYEFSTENGFPYRLTPPIRHTHTTRLTSGTLHILVVSSNFGLKHTCSFQCQLWLLQIVGI